MERAFLRYAIFTFKNLKNIFLIHYGEIIIVRL